MTGRETTIATVSTLGVIWATLGIIHGSALFLSAVLVAAATGWFYRNKFGGITGDCLGRDEPTRGGRHTPDGGAGFCTNDINTNGSKHHVNFILRYRKLDFSI